MNADEIVWALRICNRPKGHRCSECPIFSRYEHRACKATVDKAAADLIESLQAEIKRLYDEAETNYKIHAALTEDFYGLRAQLSASRRREKAAVEDLKLHGGCPSCVHRIGKPPHSPCEKFAMDKQNAYIRCLAYEWRGLQAGEGEAK